jgi:hypothetical protein
VRIALSAPPHAFSSTAKPTAKYHHVSTLLPDSIQPLVQKWCFFDISRKLVSIALIGSYEYLHEMSAYGGYVYLGFTWKFSCDFIIGGVRDFIVKYILKIFPLGSNERFALPLVECH